MPGGTANKTAVSVTMKLPAKIAAAPNFGGTDVGYHSLEKKKAHVREPEKKGKASRAIKNIIARTASAATEVTEKRNV
jgi:hypothetical protein